MLLFVELVVILSLKNSLHKFTGKNLNQYYELQAKVSVGPD